MESSKDLNLVLVVLAKKLFPGFGMERKQIVGGRGEWRDDGWPPWSDSFSSFCGGKQKKCCHCSGTGTYLVYCNWEDKQILET